MFLGVRASCVPRSLYFVEGKFSEVWSVRQLRGLSAAPVDEPAERRKGRKRETPESRHAERDAGSIGEPSFSSS